jgi:DNA polymerase-3 subunit beta
MIIKFSIAAFAEAAKAIRNIPSGRIEIDALDHALISAQDGEMRLTMSNMDIEGRVIVECETDDEITVAIPRPILDFFTLRATAGDDAGILDFSDDRRQVTARNGRARMTLPVLPGDMFPLFPDREPTWSMTLRAHELVGILRTCEKAISEEVTRFYLCGVFVHIEDGDLIAVATDGHRLHFGSIDAPEMKGEMPSRDDARGGVIIPDKTVAEIIRIFDGDESEITISGTAAVINIDAERIRIVSKLVDGVYPDYARLIQKPSDFRMTVSAKAIEAAINRLIVIPKKDHKGKAEIARAIRMTPCDDGLRLEVKGNDGDAEDLIECSFEGSGEAITINQKYVREAVAAAGCEKVSFTLAAENSSAARMLTDNERTAFVLMQLRY